MGGEKVTAHSLLYRKDSPTAFRSREYVLWRDRDEISVTVCTFVFGGTNIADEYANIYPKHGYWKDTAIRLEGDAMWGLTVIFLQMWESESNTVTDYEVYRTPAEVMYRTIINNAKDYIYMTMPYLVIDNTMMEALCTAAQGYMQYGCFSCCIFTGSCS